MRVCRLNRCVPCPYPVEGGSVPIYAVTHGRVAKRNWVFRNASWCDLCKEPVALWVNHHGRKDHALMDLHYSQMVEWPRRWRAEDVLHAFLDTLGLPVDVYQRSYAVHDRERRNEIYAMILKLEEAGVLFLGDPRNSYLWRMQGGMRGMDHQGALVLHEFILGPFMRLYPEGGIQDFSNLVDFVTCSYNMETVYDLCGFYTIDRVGKDMKPSSPAAVGLGGASSSSSATSGFHQSATQSSSSGQTANDIIKAEADEEEAFSRKAVFVRQILGQLRWVLDEDQEHPTGKEFPAHVVTLAEILLKALVAEIIAVRVCEYMVRVEPVWRDFGFERRSLSVGKGSPAAQPQQCYLPELGVRFFYRHMSPNHDDLYDTASDIKPPPLEW